MKVNIKKFQQGGQAPEAGAGAEEQLMAMAQQIIEQLGPEGAAMLAEVLVGMLQQGGGGQAAPAPVYARKGTKLVRVK